MAIAVILQLICMNKVFFHFIENNSNQTISFYLLDVQGRKVTPKLQNVIGRKAVLSTEALSKGVYFIHLSNGTEKTIKKIIK